MSSRPGADAIPVARPKHLGRGDAARDARRETLRLVADLDAFLERNLKRASQLTAFAPPSTSSPSPPTRRNPAKSAFNAATPRSEAAREDATATATASTSSATATATSPARVAGTDRATSSSSSPRRGGGVDAPLLASPVASASYGAADRPRARRSLVTTQAPVAPG